MTPEPPDGDGPLADSDFARLFEDLAGLHRPPVPLLLAVSGGADSIALMGAMAVWFGEGRRQGRARPSLAVATVDHNLRPEARREALDVGRLAAELGLPHAILSWPGGRNGPVSQAAARRGRYACLAAEAGRIGAEAVVTAHTRDDQAETMLMRLAAGSGVSGLGGMAVRRSGPAGCVIRPLLMVSRASLRATCLTRGWPFHDDPSNEDARFARIRWRRILPVLAREGLDARRLLVLSRRMRRAEAALEAAAGEVASRILLPGDGAADLSFADLGSQPDEIALRVLVGAVRHAGRTKGRPPAETHLRLERAERLMAALRAANEAGIPLRRTFAGVVVDLDGAGRLSFLPEPPRSRGRARTPPDASSPQSPPTVPDVDAVDAQTGCDSERSRTGRSPHRSPLGSG